MKEYQLAFAPDLEVRPTDFVTEWNENPESRTQGEARLNTSSSTHYDPSLMDGAMAVLLVLSEGIVTNALYDLIKHLLIKKGVRKKTRITQIDKPDGTHILVITIDEE